MCSWWTYSSISSVVMPGRTNSPARRRISAATAPARRMRSMTSGDLTRGSSQAIGTPVSAYDGRPMWAGTVRIGDDDAGQHPTLGALVAALVLAPAAAPARVVGLRQRRGGVGQRAHVPRIRVRSVRIVFPFPVLDVPRRAWRLGDHRVSRRWLCSRPTAGVPDEVERRGGGSHPRVGRAHRQGTRWPDRVRVAGRRPPARVLDDARRGACVRRSRRRPDHRRRRLRSRPGRACSSSSSPPSSTSSSTASRTSLVAGAAVPVVGDAARCRLGRPRSQQRRRCGASSPDRCS